MAEDAEVGGQQPERKFTYHVFLGACKDCLPWDGLEFDESQIPSLFLHAERVSDESWDVNGHFGCRCTLETEEYGEMVDTSEYNAYWSQEQSDEGESMSTRSMMRGFRAARSPEAAAHFLSHEALKEIAPELAPIIAPILMPLITIAFQEWAKYQQYLQNQAIEKQRSIEYRQVYRSTVSE